LKKTNLQLLLIIAVSVILLSSCSQVRQFTTSSNHKLHLIKADRNTTAKVASPTVVEKRELNSLPVKDHAISALQAEKNAELKLHPANSPILPALISKKSKTDTRTEGGNKNIQRVNKAFDHLTKINEASSSNNNEEKLLPYGHYDANRFLWLWIGALILDIIFWALFVATSSAVFFGVLSFLFGVVALVFFIIWLVTISS